VTHLLVCEKVLRWGVVRLLVTRKRDFGSRQVHPVSGQNGRVLIGPQVVVTGFAVVLHPPRFDPTHLNSMYQLRHLQMGEIKQVESKT